MQQWLELQYSHTFLCQIRLCAIQQDCEFLPIVDVESILNSGLTVNNDSLSCLGHPDSGLGRMTLLRYTV
jgi:hypothetical protein